MVRRVRKLRNSNRIISFKVSEEFFNTVDKERRKFLEKTGISLTQPAMSNLILKSARQDFMTKLNIFGNGKKKTKTKR